MKLRLYIYTFFNKKAKQNNELAYHHSPGRGDSAPPVNAANPAAYGTILLFFYFFFFILTFPLFLHYLVSHTNFIYKSIIVINVDINFLLWQSFVTIVEHAFEH